MQQPGAGDAKRGDLILVVDDEAFIREGIELYLATNGYRVLTAANADAALACIAAQPQPPDVAILDILMPGMNGVELLREIRKRYPEIEVVMASANGTLQTAVEAMRLGAYDYISKPILDFEDDLLKVIRKAVERRRLLASNRRLTRDLQQVNFDLKAANSQLRRRLAELELISEAGGLLSEVSDVAALYGVLRATLDCQFEFPHSMLLIEDSSGWRVESTTGCPTANGTPPILAANASHLMRDYSGTHVSTTIDDLPEVAGTFRQLGVELAAGTPVAILPLRARADLIGYLIVTCMDPESMKERLALLALFCSQIAIPLALFLTKERE